MQFACSEILDMHKFIHEKGIYAVCVRVCACMCVCVCVHVWHAKKNHPLTQHNIPKHYNFLAMEWEENILSQARELKWCRVGQLSTATLEDSQLANPYLYFGSAYASAGNTVYHGTDTSPYAVKYTDSIYLRWVHIYIHQSLQSWEYLLLTVPGFIVHRDPLIVGRQLHCATTHVGYWQDKVMSPITLHLLHITWRYLHIITTVKGSHYHYPHK